MIPPHVDGALQVESMLKHYTVPVLLIEFNPDKVQYHFFVSSVKVRCCGECKGRMQREKLTFTSGKKEHISTAYVNM